MKTFYSIIKVVPNSLSVDSVSIGLIISDNRTIYVKFSDRKIKIAKSLVDGSAKIIDFYISQIENTISEDNKRFEDRQANLFEVPQKFSSDYFQYLHKYSNNTVQYEEPKLIDMQNPESEFDKLFILLIDSKLKQLSKPKDESFKDLKLKIEEKLITRVKDKVHTNINFNEENVLGLFFSCDVDCIGLNGAFTGAKAIDFTQSDQTIKKEISNYISLSRILENNYNKYGEKNNYYMITDEPQKISSREHQIWESIRRIENFKIIHPEESGIIAEEIERNNSKRFLKLS